MPFLDYKHSLTYYNIPTHAMYPTIPPRSRWPSSIQMPFTNQAKSRSAALIWFPTNQLHSQNQHPTDGQQSYSHQLDTAPLCSLDTCHTNSYYNLHTTTPSYTSLKHGPPSSHPFFFNHSLHHNTHNFVTTKQQRWLSSRAPGNTNRWTTCLDPIGPGITDTRSHPTCSECPARPTMQTHLVAWTSPLAFNLAGEFSNLHTEPYWSALFRFLVIPHSLMKLDSKMFKTLRPFMMFYFHLLQHFESEEAQKMFGGLRRDGPPTGCPSHIWLIHDEQDQIKNDSTQFGWYLWNHHLKWCSNPHLICDWRKRSVNLHLHLVIECLLHYICEMVGDCWAGQHLSVVTIPESHVWLWNHLLLWDMLHVSHVALVNFEEVFTTQLAVQVPYQEVKSSSSPPSLSSFHVLSFLTLSLDILSYYTLFLWSQICTLRYTVWDGLSIPHMTDPWWTGSDQKWQHPIWVIPLKSSPEVMLESTQSVIGEKGAWTCTCTLLSNACCITFVRW